MLRGMDQRRLSISHPTHVMALKLESLLQKQAKRRIIFHYQNSHFIISKAEISQYCRSRYRFGRVCNYLGS
jgi:hypothetical protein